MARHTEIADALRANGLTVVEHDGWQTRGNSTFDPAGVVLHHTASAPGKDAPSLSTVINGRPDLAGPLCNVLLARSGVCHVIAAGRANHAGTGTYGGFSGNSRWFGIEAENDGVGEPWPDVQMDAYVRCARVLAGLSSHGLVCGHKEYATPKGRKIDPDFDCDEFRRRVANEGDDMTPAECEAAVRKVLNEATAVGLLTGADTIRESVNLGRSNYNLLAALAKKVGDIKPADVDEQQIAALVLAGLSPEKIAAAIPADLAKQVADELAQRLAG